MVSIHVQEMTMKTKYLDAPAVTYLFVINILTLLKPVPVWTACWSGFTPIEKFYVVYM